MKVATTGCDVWRDFLLGRRPTLDGFYCAALRQFSPHEFAANPVAFDWLFPSDMCSLPASDAPQLDEALLRVLLQGADVLDVVGKNYAAVLDTFGMYVDHHGFVSGEARRGVLAWAAAPSYLDQRLARILRCLQLTGLCGHSRSQGRVPSDEFAYSSGFQKGVEGLIGMYRREPLMPPDWTAVGGSEQLPVLHGGRVSPVVVLQTPDEQKLLADAVLAGLFLADVVYWLSGDGDECWQLGLREFERHADKCELATKLLMEEEAGSVAHPSAVELLRSCAEAIQLAEGARAVPLDVAPREQARELYARLRMQHGAAREALERLQRGT